MSRGREVPGWAVLSLCDLARHQLGEREYTEALEEYRNPQGAAARSREQAQYDLVQDWWYLAASAPSPDLCAVVRGQYVDQVAIVRRTVAGDLLELWCEDSGNPSRYVTRTRGFAEVIG